MAAQGADPVSAIAGAVGDIAKTINAFVSKGMQREAFTKGNEVEGISIERQKELAAFQGIAGNQQTMMFLILGLTAMIVFLVFIKKKKVA
jgi:LPXTG-motif cell wall-anchored protein